MTTCNVFISGRVVWGGPEKQTKNGRPMKSVVVAVDDQDEGGLPALMVTVIGDEAKHLDKGSWLSAEGTPEMEIVERDGKPVIRWRMLARRVILSGADHAEKRRAEPAQRGQATKAKNAEARRQGDLGLGGNGRDSTPPSEPPDREPPESNTGCADEACRIGVEIYCGQKVGDRVALQCAVDEHNLLGVPRCPAIARKKHSPTIAAG